MRITRINVEVHDIKNDFSSYAEITLENYRDLRDNHEPDPIEMFVEELNLEIDSGIKIRDNLGEIKGE